VRPDVPYFNLQTPENNPRVSWRHELSDEEMKITEPLMEKIQQLRPTPKKELSGIQLIRTFIECQI
jgi:hypothetical protein